MKKVTEGRRNGEEDSQRCPASSSWLDARKTTASPSASQQKQRLPRTPASCHGGNAEQPSSSARRRAHIDSPLIPSQANLSTTLPLAPPSPSPLLALLLQWQPILGLEGSLPRRELRQSFMWLNRDGRAAMDWEVVDGAGCSRVEACEGEDEDSKHSGGGGPRTS